MSWIHKLFSERRGYTKPKPTQREGMDDRLRVDLWNRFWEIITILSSEQNPMERFYERNKLEYCVLEDIWTGFMYRPVDEFQLPSGGGVVKSFFKDEDWFRVFDLVEFIANRVIPRYNSVLSHQFITLCNTSLKRENSAYTIINGLVTPITNEQEIGSIEDAYNAPYESVRKHLNQSLVLFSDREQPDYRNSIKEAISAVESLAKEVTRNDKESLGKLIEKLPLQHPSFKKALHNLFGFTSDAGGIRHGEKPNENLPIDQNTARFMLVTCSAFINYIISQDSGLRNDKPEED